MAAVYMADAVDLQTTEIPLLCHDARQPPPLPLLSLPPLPSSISQPPHPTSVEAAAVVGTAAVEEALAAATAAQTAAVACNSK